MAGKAVDPKDLKQNEDSMITEGGSKIRKGAMMAIITNIKSYEDPALNESSREEIKQKITMQLQEIAASGIFEYFTCKLPEIQKIIDDNIKS